MRHKHVEFLETTLVEQHRDALAGGVFAALMLFSIAFAAAKTSFSSLCDQLADFFSSLFASLLYWQSFDARRKR